MTFRLWRCFMITPFWNRWDPPPSKKKFPKNLSISDKEISDSARPLPPPFEVFPKKTTVFLCLPLPYWDVKDQIKLDTFSSTNIYFQTSTFDIGECVQLMNRLLISTAIIDTWYLIHGWCIYIDGYHIFIPVSPWVTITQASITWWWLFSWKYPSAQGRK